MASLASLRKAALALPAAREVEWYGAPMFNVGKKTFVFQSSQDKRWVFKLPPARQDFLFEVRPDVFRPWSNGGMRWSYVAISELGTKEARAFVTEAWATVVPKKISRPYIAEHAPELADLV